MSVKVRIKEDQPGENKRLELSSGEKYNPGSEQTFHLRKEQDPAVVEFYLEDRLEILEGGKNLKQRIAQALTENNWNAVVSGIEEGQYDELLEVIEEQDDRDSVTEAAQTRRQSIQEEADE